MARKRKESYPLSVRMDINTYNRLTAFCDSSGQSKTLAIERALNSYIDEYDSKMKQLKASNKI